MKRFRGGKELRKLVIRDSTRLERLNTQVLHPTDPKRATYFLQQTTISNFAAFFSKITNKA